MTKRFFATVQNKLHWAIHGQTAAEVIYQRASADKENMGLTSWKEIAVGCKRFLQNSIILWNYLQLSESLIHCENDEEREANINIIKNGTVMVWQHINMYGEYDFAAYKASNDTFDMDKIMDLQIKAA